MKRSFFLPLAAVAASLSMTQAAVITWGAVGTNIQSTDLITAGTFAFAANGGSDAGGAVTVAGMPFVVAPIAAGVPGTVSNTGNGWFYSTATDDANLDIVLDSHTYISGANPGGIGRVDMGPLTPGNTYMVQMIAVGDTRGCCALRTQTVEDEFGNVSGAMARGDGAWVVGTFVADGTGVQSVFVAGATDPGLSGLVLRDLGVIPEPSGAVLTLLGLAGLALRRRR
jgi:hypothetical protein